LPEKPAGARWVRPSVWSGLFDPVGEASDESPEQVISGVDAVIVTHTHLDHWADAAQKALPKGIPLFAHMTKMRS